MSFTNLVEAASSPYIGHNPWQGTNGLGHVANFVWDTNTLAWIKQTAVDSTSPATNVTVTNFPASYPITAASLPLPTGAATSANQTTEITSLQLLDDVPTAMNGAFSKGVPMMGQLDDTSTTAATEDNCAPVRITPQRAKHVNLRNQAGTEIGTSSNPVRTDPTGTTTQPVSLASIAAGLPVVATTATLSNVAASTSSVTALASNANRKKAFFYNDSTSICYLKFGTTASSSSYTHQLQPNDNFIEDGLSIYSGIVTAIWVSATGNLRVTEVTP